jgi:hypothetical protein
MLELNISSGAALLSSSTWDLRGTQDPILVILALAQYPSTALFSYTVQGPARVIVVSMLDFKWLCHLSLHCYRLRTRNQRGNFFQILVDLLA